MNDKETSVRVKAAIAVALALASVVPDSKPNPEPSQPEKKVEVKKDWYVYFQPYRDKSSRWEVTDSCCMGGIKFPSKELALAEAAKKNLGLYTKSIRKSVPEVTLRKSFRPSGPTYNPSHSCPSCGRSQYRVSGSGPRPGSHTHTCSFCSTSWYH